MANACALHRIAFAGRQAHTAGPTIPAPAMDSTIRRQTIADLLHRTARRVPAKPGLICGATQWTFAEFDAVVDRVAAGLAQYGVTHESRVAVLARNSHAFAALRFALARLGAVLVPINFMLKAEEVAF